MCHKFLDCAFCNSAQSVEIFYSVNIENNSKGYSAFCRNCGENTSLYPNPFIAEKVWLDICDFVRNSKKGDN